MIAKELPGEWPTGSGSCEWYDDRLTRHGGLSRARDFPTYVAFETQPFFVSHTILEPFTLRRTSPLKYSHYTTHLNDERRRVYSYDRASRCLTSATTTL